MSTLGFGLVLAAAFCHAIWNFFVKRINGGPELVWLFDHLGGDLSADRDRHCGRDDNIDFRLARTGLHRRQRRAAPMLGVALLATA